MNMMQRIFPSMVMLALLSSLLNAQVDSAPGKPAAAKTETSVQSGQTAGTLRTESPVPPQKMGRKVVPLASLPRSS